MIKARIFAAVLFAALSACNKQPDKQVVAGGEILPGSASDAMLPVDTVTSQPPLAPRTDKGPAADASETPAADTGDLPGPPADPAPPQG